MIQLFKICALKNSPTFFARISQNCTHLRPIRTVIPIFRTRKKYVFSFAFLGFHLSRDNKKNIIPNVDYNVSVTIKQNKRDNIKKGFLSSIFYAIYDFLCIIRRACRLGLTFIPIAALYPSTYLGDRFEKIWWSLLLTAIESSGPIFVKLGQWASNRHDLFPNACCLQFSKLQRRAKSHSWEYTKKILRKSFGKNWRKIFVKFDNKSNPIGSGCVAQVYKVWISPDHISNTELFEEFINDLEDERENHSTFVDDGLEVLGFGNIFNRSHAEDFEQNEAFTEWRNYRNEKRAAASLPSISDRSKQVSFQSVESVAGELVEELLGESTTSISHDSDNIKGEDEQKQVDHILAEQWMESLDSYEKSLPVDADKMSHLEGLVPVALKICHPGVKSLLRRDMTILRFAASFISFIFPPLKWLALPQCVDEFEKFLSAQVDMKEEAKNLERFSEFFSDVETVRFPKPIMNMVNSEVLVESFEEGEAIIDIIAADNLEMLKQNLANIGVNALLKMVFVDNFTHGDLHPGNVLVQNRTFDNEKKAQRQDGNLSKLIMMDVGTDIFVMDVVPDPNPLRICLLDCGVVSQLGERELSLFKSVMTEVIKRDGGSVAELFLEHSNHKCPDKIAFKNDMKTLVEESLDRVTALEKVDLGNLLHSVLSLLMRHKVRLDSSFSSIIISMIVLEGLGRSLDPNLDILSKAKQFLL